MIIIIILTILSAQIMYQLHLMIKSIIIVYFEHVLKIHPHLNYYDRFLKYGKTKAYILNALN